MKDWVEILIRSVSLFLIVLFFTRIMGKGSLSRMSPFKLINLTVMAIIASFLSLKLTTLTFGSIALSVWVLLTIALEYLSIKSKWVHDLVFGKETVLIKQGKVMEENLLQVRLTGEELLRELRSKNAFNLADVEFAVMETTGEISVLLKSDKKPITPHDFGQKVAPQSESQTVILDGNILDEPLSNMGLNRRWLITQLSGLGIALENVFIGQVDSSGDLYVDLFDDSIQTPQPKVKELLYANLERTHADLLKFALQTENAEAKDVYSKDAAKLDAVLNKLKPYLLH
ncbi:hypothetical protein OXPF_04800 [Oxobacter pfennigii]|uniref:YetF C-terminal domain-containing protein n=1 Tax=Oxobacter pfennigii TaxID=36849 RepID=A0A0N8NTW9_9CLOT|nr:DUF421 domain-containing protein [Oxobacter pfennigii]KPU46000.1 hypothetical protein OXPF_04800 [Oxobacter pfennigii]